MNLELDFRSENPFSISDLTQMLKTLVEPSFQNIWVRGEISNFKVAASGHAYFTLKDDSATLSAASFGWRRRSSGQSSRDFQDGTEVLCRGRLSIYPPRGSYQLVVEHMELLGQGALHLEFEKLKKRLAQEGLFDSNLKKELPNYPKRVAIVTSPTGAVIRDILTVLDRRAPHLDVLVVGARVQGDGAVEEMIQAIQTVESLELADLIVVARGGGSLEDLWCFNSPDLAYAIHECNLPIISAVGHETDFTISDFVADLRAPTPSAAAEVLSEGLVRGSNQIAELSLELESSWRRYVDDRRRTLREWRERIRDPRDQIRDQIQNCDEWYERICRGIKGHLERSESKLKFEVARLDAMSPLRVLDRGYAVVHDLENCDRIVRNVKDVSQGQDLKIRFHDGTTKVQVV